MSRLKYYLELPLDIIQELARRRIIDLDKIRAFEIEDLEISKIRSLGLSYAQILKIVENGYPSTFLNVHTLLTDEDCCRLIVNMLKKDQLSYPTLGIMRMRGLKFGSEMLSEVMLAAIEQCHYHAMKQFLEYPFAEFAPETLALVREFCQPVRFVGKYDVPLSWKEENHKKYVGDVLAAYEKKMVIVH